MREIKLSTERDYPVTYLTSENIHVSGLTCFVRMDLAGGVDVLLIPVGSFIDNAEGAVQERYDVDEEVVIGNRRYIFRSYSGDHRGVWDVRLEEV